MPGVAILHPGVEYQLSQSLTDKNEPYNDQDKTHSPAMYNGLPNDNLSVAEVKAKAKEDVRKAAKGVSPLSLIKTARTQLEQARINENQGNLKGALGALLRTGSLIHMFMNSSEFMAENKPGKHGMLYREFVNFQKFEGGDIRKRVQAIEEKLGDLEKSAAADNDNADAGATKRVGTSIADRLKKLNDAGLNVDTSKRSSREFPTVPSTPTGSVPLRSPEPIRTHKLSPSLIPLPPQIAFVPSSSTSSTTSSPHAVVPPSSLGPPSPTSSESSLPPLAHNTVAEFTRAFPSIDELDELAATLPSIPHPTGSSNKSHRSSTSHANGINGLELPTSPPFKPFPSLSIDPGPRPSSTPITPTLNAFISRPASPTITWKPSINGLVSKPAPIPEKPTIPSSNTIRPSLLHEFMASAGVKTLIVDVRTREEFDTEHIKSDAVVCLEPSVLSRSSVTAANLEDSLLVAPREEWVLFENRDKFDLVVLYDASSEMYDVTGPLSVFVKAVFDGAFRKFLRHAPMLLVGGFQAWKREFPDEIARGAARGVRGSPSILQNGINSTSGAILSSVPDSFRSRPLPIPSLTSDVSSEKRHPELPSQSPLEKRRLPAKPLEVDTVSDGPAYIVRRNAVSRPPSSISHTHSQSENISSSPRPMASITYPSFSSAAPPPVPSTSFSPSPSNFTPVSLPPQASINPSPLARRRSDFMDSTSPTASGFAHRSTPIEYPDLVLRPPPPVASPVSERQDSRPRLLHTPSYSISVLNHAGPKPPTIKSEYPVVYWSDMRINTTGLKNLGNTCYMNATIQCLSATVPFARFFAEGLWRNAINMLNPLGTKGSVVNAFAGILYEMSHSELPHLNPIMFRKSICGHAAQFSGADQHDSQEFLTFLLDGLHEDLNRVLTKPSNEPTPEREAELEKLPQQIASEQEWEIYRMRNDSLIVDYFQGQFRNRMECLTCHHTSTTYNPFMYLSLPIPAIKGPSKVPLYQCLDAFVKEEVLEKSEAWHCPKCKTLRSASKILSLSRLPPVLLIHLKRFSVKGPFTDKIETVVDFPLKGLDLTNYMPPPLPPEMRKSADKSTPMSVATDPRVQVPPYRYDLYGVTNHFGNLSNGHYTAFIASRPGWKYCDDSKITDTDAKEVVGRPAYVLYYKRVKS